MRFWWMIVAGCLCLAGPGQSLAQSAGDSLRINVERLMGRLKPDYQHTGYKIRFDTALEVPLSSDIRINKTKILPGFGFNLGLGFGFTDYLSFYTGFISLSHTNDDKRNIGSRQVGFDGFHADVRVKVNPYSKHQFYLEPGIGFYELVDQKSDGFTGRGYSLTAGFDRYLTRELSLSVSLMYRLTRFDLQFRGEDKTTLTEKVKADMLLLSATFIYTLNSENQGLF